MKKLVIILLGTLAYTALVADPLPTSVPSLEEVIITGDFRPDDLQNTANSLTVMSEEIIRSRNAQHLEEISSLAPNVNFSQGSNRARYFQIRGIGERSQFKEPINPSVGMIIDDVDFTGIGTAATLFDVEQVEILRGPQGTRYGANALAGLINIKTKTPGKTPEVHIEKTEADYNTHSLGIAVNTPLVSDTLYARLAVQFYQSDGFIENTYLNKDDTNGRDELTTRLKFRWLTTEDLTLDFNFFHADIDNGYDAFSLDNTRETLSDEPGRDAQKTTTFSIKSKWNVNKAVILEGTLSTSNTDMEYSYDEDWTYAGIAPDWEYSSFDQYLRDRSNKSVELRFLSDDAGKIFSNTTDWVVGIYHLNKEEDLTRNYTYNAEPYNSEYSTTSTAIYGQLDSQLNKTALLTFGLRAESWNAEYEDSNALDIDHDESLFGGKIGLEFRLSEDQLIYTGLSKGYKAGGVNTDGALPENQLNFDTEYLWNIETGIKSSWLNNSLKSRIAIFYAQRMDQQVKGSFVKPIEEGSDTCPCEFIDHINNAAEGKNYGLEIEIDWLATEALQLFTNLGLLETELKDYITSDGINMSGREQAHAPAYQFAIGGQYNFDSGLFIRTEAEGKDGFYFSDRHDKKSDAYELLNAKIGYQANQWQVALWGRNLTDEDYHTRGFNFPNDPRDEYTSIGYTQLGEPRMIGITFNLDI